MTDEMPENYRLKTVDKVDYDALCADWEWEDPETVNIATRICDEWAAKTPDRTALFWENADRVERSLTFGEMANRSNRCGNAMSDAGIKWGDIVALYLPSCPELLVATLGSHKIGAVNLPMYQLFGPDGVATRLEATEPEIIFTDPTGLETLDRVPGDLMPDRIVVLTRYDEGDAELAATDYDTVRYRDFLDGTSASLDVAETAQDDPAQIFFTSGTTGDPKGVVQPHRTAIGHQHLGKFIREYHHEDLLYHIGSFVWAGGFNNLIHAWALGAPIAKYDGKFDATICLDLMEKYDADILMAPPTALRELMDFERETIDAYDIDLRILATGGERVTKDVLVWAESTFDLFATTIWGQTECYGIGWPAVGDEHREKLGTAGKVLPGFDAAILDEDGNELGPGEVGELAIGRDNPTLFLEYYNDPEATAAAREGSWHLTGDAASVDEDGYYWIQGRVDDIIISAGYRLSPSEIESCLNEHPAVLESAAVGVDDERRTNTVLAFVQLNSGYKESSALRDELRAYVKDHLAKFQYPDEISFVDDIPKTITGKIQRRKLAARRE